VSKGMSLAHAQHWSTLYVENLRLSGVRPGLAVHPHPSSAPVTIGLASEAALEGWRPLLQADFARSSETPGGYVGQAS
jgi:hypothetical protein